MDRLTVKLKDSIIGLRIEMDATFLTERQSMSGGGVQREGDTESKVVSRLRAVSTESDARFELTNCEIKTPKSVT